MRFLIPIQTSTLTRAICRQLLAAGISKPALGKQLNLEQVAFDQLLCPKRNF